MVESAEVDQLASLVVFPAIPVHLKSPLQTSLKQHCTSKLHLVCVCVCVCVCCLKACIAADILLTGLIVTEEIEESVETPANLQKQ